MPPLRHRTRHLRATMRDRVEAQLDALGWITPPVNFGTDPLTVIDYQPEERGEIVVANTVAVSIGDVINDEDEELGAADGGLRSAWYPVFLDVYMSEQALSDAVCDDLRTIFDASIFPLINQITGEPCDGQAGRTSETIDVEECLGPDRPVIGVGSIEAFKKSWRIIRLGCRLYYQS